jgi:epoxyqueuosine reductase
MIDLIELKKNIISCAKDNDADLIGFAGRQRFKDNPLLKAYPEVKTVIGMAFRVLRGSYRGIEEGSTYYQYTTTGVETIEETIMPMALLRVSSLLEDARYLAIPQRKNQTIMQEEDDTNPEISYSEIYRGAKAENTLDFEQAAVLCGLGEIGLSGSLLTDDFGPFQRYCFILTDALLEETSLAEPHLCDNCMECIKACPGKAIAEDGKRDNWQCAAYYMGANITKNPFMPKETFLDDPERLAIITGKAKLTPKLLKLI